MESYVNASLNVYITKKMKRPLVWNQGITHHIKLRLKTQTLFSPGGQVERWGRHLMWAQTFIYYLLLQRKDKGNEDDYPVTGKTDEPARPDWTVHLLQTGPKQHSATWLTSFYIFLINSHSSGVCSSMPYVCFQSMSNTHWAFLFL